MACSVRNFAGRIYPVLPPALHRRDVTDVAVNVRFKCLVPKSPKRFQLNSVEDVSRNEILKELCPFYLECSNCSFSEYAHHVLCINCIFKAETLLGLLRYPPLYAFSPRNFFDILLVAYFPLYLQKEDVSTHGTGL